MAVRWGLFTAISRLRAVHRRSSSRLAEAGLPLYAQHVDPMDTGTLVDIFRAERDACLLGTDAVRDGVDVPGDSLRLIVLDRVPWPTPTILERARKEAFGGNAYIDMVVRLRLRQAFGRLIRHSDHGILSCWIPVWPHGSSPPFRRASPSSAWDLLTPSKRCETTVKFAFQH